MEMLLVKWILDNVSQKLVCYIQIANFLILPNFPAPFSFLTMF